MELQQQSQHDASLRRQNKLHAILDDNEICVNTLFDVTTASLFCAEAFRREQLHLDQGKTRDYILYNGGLIDQPTSPITLAEQLPELENVLSTGAGFLLESGEANFAVTMKVFEVLNSMAELVQEERWASREAQVAAEAAIASSKVAEMRVNQLEMKMRNMEMELSRLREERDEARAENKKIQDEMNVRQPQRQEAEENVEGRRQDDEVIADQPERESPSLQQRDHEQNDHQHADDQHDDAASETGTSQTYTTTTTTTINQNNEQEQEHRQQSPPQLNARNLLRPVTDDNSNLVSPFAFFTKKTTTSQEQQPQHGDSSPSREQQQEQQYRSHSATTPFTMPNVHANTFKPINTATTPSKANGNTNNARSLSASGVDDNGEVYDTYIVNNRAFVAPRWASASVFSQVSAEANLNHLRSQSVYEPPSKPLERKSNILEVVMGSRKEFSPQDLDWGRSVTADPYREEDHDKVWEEHAKKTFEHSDLMLRQQQQKMMQQPTIVAEFNHQDPNNNNTNSNFVMPANAWANRTPSASHQQRRDDTLSSPDFRNNNDDESAQTAAVLVYQEKKPVEYFAPKPEDLQDKDKVPPAFIHPADLLKQRASAPAKHQHSSGIRGGGGGGGDHNNNNNNNVDDAVSDHTNTNSQRFLLSEHMRHGEARAIISVASGVATRTDDYAIDTTLDWLKRMSHGPMLQLEQTLLQRDYYERSPPTNSRGGAGTIAATTTTAKRTMLSQEDMEKLLQPSANQQQLEILKSASNTNNIDYIGNNSSRSPSQQQQQPQTDETSSPQRRGSQLEKNAQQPVEKLSYAQLMAKKAPLAAAMGKPPLANNNNNNNNSSFASSPPNNNSMTKKSPNKFQSVGKKVMAQNKQQQQQQQPVYTVAPLMSNASFGAKSTQSSATHDGGSGGVQSPPTSPPAAKKTMASKLPSTGNAVVVGKNSNSKAGSVASSVKGSSSPPSLVTKNSNNNNNSKIANVSTKSEPAVPESGQMLSTENLTIHTKTLTGGKEVPSASARHVVDPHAPPPQPGQIVETEEEILEHLEKDSNYGEKLLMMSNQNNQVTLISATQNENNEANNNNNNLQQNYQATNNNKNNSSSLNNTRSSETNSLKQIHSLLGGTQPSVHREAGAPELLPDEVEDTTPAPFRRRSNKEALDITPHQNTQSEDQYFQQSGGVLHALHRVLQQETRERREAEVKAARSSSDSQQQQQQQHIPSGSPQNRSASGGSYYSEY